MPPLNRDSRRMLDKHFCTQIVERVSQGPTNIRTFRWTKLDETIYELASARDGAGWSKEAFLELLPELKGRLKLYEARAQTLNNIGYLTPEGRVSDAFDLHYRVHKGDDHPELQRLRADLHKAAGRSPRTPPTAPARAAPGTPTGDTPDVDLWMTLHRHQRLVRRLERLGIPPEEFKRLQREARRHLPTPEVLAELRAEARREIGAQPDQPAAMLRTKGVIRAYWGLHRGRLVSYFVLAKGLITLSPHEHAALARQIRQRAEVEYFLAKEKKLALVAHRLRPFLWVGDIVMPDDARRLRVALERCEHLASIQRAEQIIRERRPGIVRTAHSAPPHAGAISPEPVAHLEAGLEVLRLHKPAHFAPLAPWRDRVQELALLIAGGQAGAKDELPPEVRRRAIVAGRLGGLLAGAAKHPPSQIPPNLRDQGSDIQVANARFAAAGVPVPFPTATLGAAPPSAIATALVTVRHAGFLSEGPEWSLRAESAPEVLRLVRRPLERFLEQDLGR